MPTIEVSFSDLQKLVGKKLPIDEKLNDLLAFVKGEVENFENDSITIKLEDSNRPDLWCAEGIARELRGVLGLEAGLKRYAANPSDYRIIVNGKLEKIRGFIACAIIKGIKLSDQLIKQLMQQQDKIDTTYGRNRRKTSIGMYKFDLLSWPLKYTMTKPHENNFVPLNFEEKLSPHEILKRHPKGAEYGSLLKGLEEYPIFLDAEGKVLSMPPVINSNDLGQIDESTENLLVEVTGTDYNAVNNVLKIISASLVDRGGKIYSVQIDYPYRKIDTTPNFETRRVSVSLQKVNDLLGLKLDSDEITRLLQKMRYNVLPVAEHEDIPHSLDVEIPAYRFDIMHPVDICEDIAIAHDFNKFNPELPAIPTVGKLSDAEKLSNKVREICTGLGAQEIFSFDLTNKESLFKLMSTKEEHIIELENPVSLTYGCLRNKLLPSLLEFLSKNTKKEYPQKIFEVGDVVYPDSDKDEMSVTEKKLAFAISHSEATFTEVKQVLGAMFSNLDKTAILKEIDHDSFIAGRCAAIYLEKEKIGIIGEIHPQVLENWGLEMPIVGFEISLNYSY